MPIQGKFVRLTAGILGIYSVDGQRTAVMIPEGALMRVAVPASDTRLIDVIWEDKVLAVSLKTFSSIPKI